MFLNPQHVSVRPGGAVLPVGMVVGYAGTIATIPAGWALCDGAGGTPDLAGRHVIGDQGGFAYGVTSGSNTAPFTGALSSAGAHTSDAATGGGQGGGGAAGGVLAIAGAHGHSNVSGTVAADGPSLHYLPIMHVGGGSVIPQDSILWHYDAATPAGFAVEAAMEGRFLKYSLVEANTGVPTGGETQGVVLTGDSDGAHLHNSGNQDNSPTSNPNRFLTTGAHDVSGVHNLTIELPPFKTALPVRATGDAAPVVWNMVSYFGEIANLPPGWSYCDGSPGTPDMRGRFPIGRDAGDARLDAIGETGGSVTRSVSGTVTHSATHDHQSAGTDAGNGYHGPYDWTHIHTLTGATVGMPQYLALRYIIYTG